MNVTKCDGHGISTAPERVVAIYRSERCMKSGKNLKEPDCNLHVVCGNSQGCRHGAELHVNVAATRFSAVRMGTARADDSMTIS